MNVNGVERHRVKEVKIMADVKNLPWDENYMEYMEQRAELEVEPMSVEEYNLLLIEGSKAAAEDEMRDAYPEWSAFFLDYMEETAPERFEIEPMTIEEYSEMCLKCGGKEALVATVPEKIERVMLKSA